MSIINTDVWQRFKFLGNVSSNPGFDACAFVVTTTDYKNDKYKHNIWLYQQERMLQLTGFDDESTYVWLDDQTILFTSNRSKNKEEGIIQTDFFTISIHGGEAKKAFSIPMIVTDFKVLDQKTLIMSALCDVDFADIHKADKETIEKRAKTKKDEQFFEIIDQIPFYFNGSSFTSGKRNRLYRYDISNETLTPLTKIDFQVSSFQLSTDRTFCIVVGAPFRDVAKLINDLYEIDLKSKKIKKLSKGKQLIAAAYQIQNEILALVKPNNATYGLNQNVVITKFDRKKGTFESLVDPIYSIGNSINSDIRYAGSSLVQVIQDKLYYTLNVHDHSRLMEVDKDGNVRTIVDWPGSIDGYALVQGQWIFAALTRQQPQELYDIDQKALTSFNKLDEPLQIIAPKIIEFHIDHRQLKGWVLLPPKFSTKKKYPAILNIHGGPKTIYGEVYVHEMQVWANHGYVVMFTNPTGSDGQDNAFSDIRGKYGTIDYDDLMGFVDTVLDKYPNIDTKRLGVTGGSYGGFMTNWIIGHTQRFACAITQRSISNWTSFYGVSDIGYYFTQDQQQASMQKPQDMEKLWFHSPIKYVDQMKTPTLIIHSAKDYRCPVEQGYQLFTCLKENKVPTKMVMFHNENHDLSRNGKPKARQKRLDEMFGWFEQYLK